MTIGIAKVPPDGNKLYFLRAIHPAVKALGYFLLTGWLADENLLVFKNFKI